MNEKKVDSEKKMTVNPIVPNTVSIPKQNQHDEQIHVEYVANGNDDSKLTLAAIADILNREGIFCTYRGELYHYHKLYVGQEGLHGFYELVVGDELESLRFYIYNRFMEKIDSMRNPTKSIDEVIDFLRYKCRQMTVDMYENFKVIFQDGLIFDLSRGMITPMYIGPEYFSSHYMRVNGADVLAAPGLHELGGAPISIREIAKIEWPQDPDLWAAKVLEQMGGVICCNIGKAIVTWVGASNSFKSTLMNTIICLWSVDSDLFVQTADGIKDKFGLDNILKKVCAYFPDFQEGNVSRIAVSIIKELSGNDPFRHNVKFGDGSARANMMIPIVIVSNHAVDFKDVAANKRCSYIPFTTPISDYQVGTKLFSMVQIERLSIIKTAIEMHIARVAAGQPLKTPWVLNSCVNADSDCWKDYLWNFIRTTLVPNEGFNIDKQQIYKEFILALKAGGISEECLPERTEFNSAFNGMFEFVFEDFRKRLKQVRSSRSGESLKGIENFGFHPERFAIRRFQ